MRKRQEPGYVPAGEIELIKIERSKRIRALSGPRVPSGKMPAWAVTPKPIEPTDLDGI